MHTSDGQTYVPIYDGNGNVMALADGNTGEEVATWTYGPFGELLDSTGRTELCPFGFATHYTDRESGLVYFGYRYYSPETGRWLSREPLGEFESWNLYAYCHNDPVNKMDVLGLYERISDKPALIVQNEKGGFDILFLVLKSTKHRRNGGRVFREVGFRRATSISENALRDLVNLDGLGQSGNTRGNRYIDSLRRGEELKIESNQAQADLQHFKNVAVFIPGGAAGTALAEGKGWAAGGYFALDVGLTVTGTKLFQAGGNAGRLAIRGTAFGAGSGFLYSSADIGFERLYGEHTGTVGGDVTRVIFGTSAGAALGLVGSRFGPKSKVGSSFRDPGSGPGGPFNGSFGGAIDEGTRLNNCVQCVAAVFKTEIHGELISANGQKGIAGLFDSTVVQTLRGPTGRLNEAGTLKYFVSVP